MTRAAGSIRIGCSGMVVRRLAGPGVPERPAGPPVARGLRDPLRHRGAERDLLPAARARTVEAWAAQAPPGFCFAVKVGQFGSHRKKLRDARSLAAQPPRPGRAARAAPGPQPRAAPAAVAARRRPPRRLPRRGAGADLRWAVELRDPSWLHDDVFACSRPTAPRCACTTCSPTTRGSRTASWTYVRFHGPDAPDQHVPRPLRRVGASGGRRTSSASGPTTAPTSSPTSTTTSMLPRSPTPSG